MRGPVVVIGAGGHARPVIEALTLLGIAVAVLLDDAPDRQPVLGHPVVTVTDGLAAFPAAGVTDAVVAVGDNATRARIADRARAAGLDLPPLLHPAATVSPHAAIGAGAQVLARAVIGPEARLGRLVIVNTGAIVEHGCVVGNAAHVAPGAILLGAAVIGDGVLVGAGAIVLPGIRVGRDAVIGAGAVVTRDVLEGIVVIGSPARPLPP